MSAFDNLVDLPDTFTEGATREEALFNAAEVLSAMLSWHIEQGNEIPTPSPKAKGAQYTPRVPPIAALPVLASVRSTRPTATDPEPPSKKKWHYNHSGCDHGGAPILVTEQLQAFWFKNSEAAR